jgi:hypothetical protein
VSNVKSGKRRRAELDPRKRAKKEAHSAKLAAERAEAARLHQEALERAAAQGVTVNKGLLTPHNSYGEPDFVTRGFYADLPFECVDCSKAEVWTATQQKWWYEVAKGDVFTTARRCRACRRRERERRVVARSVHLEGLDRKHEGSA